MKTTIFRILFVLALMSVAHAGQVVGVLKFTPQGAPTSPSEGWLYYDTSAHTMYQYNGSSWVAWGGGSGNVSTSGSITTGTVAVFNASTTVVGTQTAPSGAFVGTTDTQTLSGKRITKRTHTYASGTSFTPDADSYDIVKQVNTGSSGTLTINAPTGTPQDGDALEIWLTCTNQQTLSFNAIYHWPSDIPQPTTTSPGGGSKLDKVKFEWDPVGLDWLCTGRVFGG